MREGVWGTIYGLYWRGRKNGSGKLPMQLYQLHACQIIPANLATACMGFSTHVLDESVHYVWPIKPIYTRG